jgi:septal ring factor EnvC (AmiA/AmiB activator)
MAEREGPRNAATERTPPAPNLTERMEGLQGWMAEIERKLNRLTYFGGAALALALIAAGAALFLAITTPDSASKDDLDDLEAEVQTLQDQVSEAAQDENTLKSVQATVQTLEKRVAAAEQKSTKNAAKIGTLKSRVAKVEATPPTTTTAPTTTTPAPAAGETKP